MSVMQLSGMKKKVRPSEVVQALSGVQIKDFKDTEGVPLTQEARPQSDAEEGAPLVAQSDDVEREGEGALDQTEVTVESQSVELVAATEPRRAVQPAQNKKGPRPFTGTKRDGRFAIGLSKEMEVAIKVIAAKEGKHPNRLIESVLRKYLLSKGAV